MSSQTKASKSKSPRPLLPRIQERTVSVKNSTTNKYDCYFIHQRVVIALYSNYRDPSFPALLSLVQVDERTPVCLDATQTRLLQAAIQDVAKLPIQEVKGA